MFMQFSAALRRNEIASKRSKDARPKAYKRAANSSNNRLVLEFIVNL